MTETATLAVSSRVTAGKGGARATRRDGKVPGIVYGSGGSNLAVSVDSRTLDRHLHRSGFFNSLLDLEIDGKPEKVIPRTMQVDPVTDRPLHIDFLRVDPNAMIAVAIPVVFVNELASPGIRRGGVLNVVRHNIELICPVLNIPAAITVDLTGLDIGDSIHISHVTLPANTRPTITERDFTIASVAAPTVHVEETVAKPDEAAAAVPGAPAAPGAAAPAAAGTPEKKA
ncbi:MAG: 50S ribosomal protein L25/general stress protein Ctc [Alphaproteobacteria bacterium]|nr:50S ribosomal protein L25/general stress protein Ctc [Alphaproteobacteria bacterium]